MVASSDSGLVNEQPKESTASIVRRAVELSQQLRVETEKLNEALCHAEDTFMERLGPGARGRVVLQRGEVLDKKRKPVGKRPWVEFLIYKDDEFFIESNRNEQNRFTMVHLLSTGRDIRCMACLKLKELWSACGGDASV